MPPFREIAFANGAQAVVPAPNPDGPAFGRKAVLYAGCHDNFNDATPGEAAMKVLAHNGVKVRDADVFRIALNIWFDMWAGTRVDAEWNALTILPWCGEYSST